ncbi:MAG: type II toxin-antitoxin system VapC family toxin [Deltaproteobacteria bacterium]
MINLDTHVLVHALAGSLTAREQRVLAGEDWGVSAIVFWELAKLVQLGRLELDLDHPDTLRALGAVEILPITLAVARASTRLDFRSDPADELIAATSWVVGMPLLTRDKRIRKSKLVPLA